MSLEMYYDPKLKFLQLSEGTTHIDEKQFQNFVQLEEVIIPDSVTEIGNYAFSGCHNLKRVTLSKNLKCLHSFAFSGCTSLEEITIPESLCYIAHGVFLDCTSLKAFHGHDQIIYIDDFAFYNCIQLEDFLLSKSLESLGIKALFGCSNIQELYIPKTLESIELDALALMTSLSKITVDPDNEMYMSLDDIALIQKNDGFLFQYAVNNPRESFQVNSYPLPLGNNQTIYNIGSYAFAGAKYLTELSLNSEIDSIGENAFLNCPNLKKLQFSFSPYGKVLLFHTFESEQHYPFPFERIIIEEGVTTISDDTQIIFENATHVSLPDTLENIGGHVFLASQKLKDLKIPANIKMIQPDTFHPNIKLHFNDFGEIKASMFHMLETRNSEIFSEDITAHNNITIFSLKDGTYHVKIDDFDIIEITRDEIRNMSQNSNLLENDPERVTCYLYNLLSINVDNNRLIRSVFSDPNLIETFNTFLTDMDYVRELAEKKLNRSIRKLISLHSLNDEFLLNGMLMCNLRKKEILNIIQNLSPSLKKLFKFNDFFNHEKIVSSGQFPNVYKVTSYCNLLEKYQRFDRFLYHPKFYSHLTTEEQELILKYYDANLKRFLIHSMVLETNDDYEANIHDLLKLGSILGVFSDHPIIRQRMTTFITERIFSEFLPDGSSNPYRIVGDRIHNVFESLHPRETIDEEFLLFFMENFKKLITSEHSIPGFISRIYNNFLDISRCSLSDQGSQRHLKVTIEKCENYLLKQCFLGFTEENKELAQLLKKYYSNKYVLEVAVHILNEANEASRNIFAKWTKRSDGKVVYDCSKEGDLKGAIGGDFCYEWLPKQSVDNLILGKFCNCCAHITGQGAGIMKASMILDNCQNLVIRDSNGIIIAKMTLWINKEEQNAVFNTAEVSESIQDPEQYEKIYVAFMSGMNAFLNEYNRNNPQKPLQSISIGTNRNKLKDYLEKDGYQENVLFPSPDYSSYSYFIGDQKTGLYCGDSSKQQILLFRN